MAVPVNTDAVDPANGDQPARTRSAIAAEQLEPHDDGGNGLGPPRRLEPLKKIVPHVVEDGGGNGLGPPRPLEPCNKAAPTVVKHDSGGNGLEPARPPEPRDKRVDEH